MAKLNLLASLTPEKKVLLKNLKKLMKHMSAYLIQIKNQIMINMALLKVHKVSVALVVVKVLEALETLTSEIYLVISLEAASVVLALVQWDLEVKTYKFKSIFHLKKQYLVLPKKSILID